MFSHITVGITDFDRALAFWRPLMAGLSAEERLVDPARPWAVWQPPGGGRPLFLILRPEDGAAAAPGNGAMVAFTAPDRATVDRLHAVGLASGGQDAGGPGLRPQYHAQYYGAYLRDPDGNKLCLVCHLPPDRAG